MNHTLTAILMAALLLVFIIATVWITMRESTEDRNRERLERLDRAVRHRRIQDFARKQELERWKECEDDEQN